MYVKILKNVRGYLSRQEVFTYSKFPFSSLTDDCGLNPQMSELKSADLITIHNFNEIRSFKMMTALTAVGVSQLFSSKQILLMCLIRPIYLHLICG